MPMFSVARCDAAATNVIGRNLVVIAFIRRIRGFFYLFFHFFKDLRYNNIYFMAMNHFYIFLGGLYFLRGVG